MTFEASSNAIDASDFDRIEKDFGFNFPAEFRKLYAASNGGRPTKNKLIGENDTYVVNTFLPIRYSIPRISTMERSIQRLKIDQQLLPDYLVPFAVDSFGGYFCFSVRRSEYGTIYIFRIERWKEPDDATTLLAPSLTDFLERLV